MTLQCYLEHLRHFFLMSWVTFPRWHEDTHVWHSMLGHAEETCMGCSATCVKTADEMEFDREILAKYPEFDEDAE